MWQTPTYAWFVPRRDLRAILDKTDDGELCNGVVFDLIEEDVRLDTRRGTDHERTVVLVWCADGVINNGGFHFLFEQAWPDDASFGLLIDALTEIGCVECAEAVADLIALFPCRFVPPDIGDRLHVYLNAPQAERERLDKRYWKSSDELPAKLAAYIRANRTAFEAELNPPSTPATGPTTGPPSTPA